MTTKGYIHIYTGNGKGKTTAALGLALRAAGAGKTIFFAQFVKGRPYSEITAINNLIPNITIKQFGRRCFIKNIPDKKEEGEIIKEYTKASSIIKELYFVSRKLKFTCQYRKNKTKRSPLSPFNRNRPFPRENG